MLVAIIYLREATDILSNKKVERNFLIIKNKIDMAQKKKAKKAKKRK